MHCVELLEWSGSWCRDWCWGWSGSWGWSKTMILRGSCFLSGRFLSGRLRRSGSWSWSRTVILGGSWSLSGRLRRSGSRGLSRTMMLGGSWFLSWRRRRVAGHLAQCPCCLCKVWVHRAAGCSIGVHERVVVECPGFDCGHLELEGPIDAVVPCGGGGRGKCGIATSVERKTMR
jgi:hypothetical protein